MQLKNKKIAYIDMDGTLLSYSLTIPENNIIAIKKWQALGNLFIIATGRPISFVHYKCETYGLKPDYVLSFNGGLITKKLTNSELFYDYLPLETVNKLVNFCFKHDLKFRALTKSIIYHNLKENIASEFQKFIEEYAIKQEEIPSDSTNLFKTKFTKNHEVIKLIIYANFIDPRYKIHQEQIIKQFPNCNVVWTKYDDEIYYIEVSNKTTDKAEAAQFIQELENISTDRTYAFGDSGNDIELLKAASFSYCPANATDEAKKATKYICTQTNEQGFVGIILERIINE